MTEKTITRADLAAIINHKVGISSIESAEFIDTAFKAIGSALEKGEEVKITGFGTFDVRSKKQRIGRNPKTLEEALIKARKVVRFKASRLLSKMVNDAA